MIREPSTFEILLVMIPFIFMVLFFAVIIIIVISKLLKITSLDAINWFKKKRDEIEAEEITIEAKVIDKFSIMRKDKLHRSTKQWLQHYNENEYMKHVDFYMVFKLKDGKNIEMNVPSEIYKLFDAENEGKLTYKGSEFISFIKE